MHMAYNHQAPAALRRVSHRQWSLKPQDLAVALKLVAIKDLVEPRPSYLAFARMLHLSPYEAHAAVQRLLETGLVASIDRRVRPVMAALRNFVMYGAPYSFPPVRGPSTIGFPTASLDLVNDPRVTQSADRRFVWPHGKGTERGQALLPLYEELPLAAVEDQKFHELLSWFDLMRIGQARERAQARERLEAVLH